MDSAAAAKTADQKGVILPLDHDRSEYSDSGYSGWVVLPDGSIYVVTYIVDDAPTAQVRAYKFTEDEF